MVRLHYTEKGEGEPLVLLHGNTTIRMDFTLSGLVDMAAERYRVIVFDRHHASVQQGLAAIQ